MILDQIIPCNLFRLLIGLGELAGTLHGLEI